METEMFVKNTAYLTSLYNYNSERREVIQKYFEDTVRNGEIFTKQVNLQDIIQFCRVTLPQAEAAKDAEPGQRIVSTINQMTLTDVSADILGVYISHRYAIERIQRPFISEYGFPPDMLFDAEFMIRTMLNNVILQSEANEIYQFKDKKEYADRCTIVEPDAKITEKFHSIALIKKSELIRGLTEATGIKIGQMAMKTGWPFEDKTIPEEIKTKISSQFDLILKAITIDIKDLYKNRENLSQRFEFDHPIIRIGDDLIIPFPWMLGTSTHIRLERLVSIKEGLEREYDQCKGEVAENTVPRIVQKFGIKNFIRNVKYPGKDGQQYEMDGILVLKDSVWVVEIKTHSLLRNLQKHPNSLIVTNYVGKILEAYEQGIHGVEYLKQNKEFVQLISSGRDLDVKGIIVLIDGFVSPLYHQNKKIDEIIGTDKIHDEVEKKGVKLLAFNLIDLEILSRQPDATRFETYVNWKSSYPTNFPLIVFDEGDSWAFRFDSWENSHERMFKAALERGVAFAYISERFNSKHYLGRMKETDTIEGVEEKMKTHDHWSFVGKMVK